MTAPPRIPGSQVAPGLRPFNRDAPTATTHSKLPMEQAHAGKTYRVRDKEWRVFATGLLHSDAHRIKEEIAGKRLSRTVQIEDEAIAMPDFANPTSAVGLPGRAEPPAQVHDAELESMRAPAIAAARSAAEAAQVRADAVARARTAPRVVAPPAAPIPAAPGKASRFVAPPMKQSAPAAAGDLREVPRDKTIQPLVMRTEPPPPDRTVSSEIFKRESPPPSSDPSPLISPLAAAGMADDPLDIPDNVPVVSDDDLSDLIAGVGGAPSEEEVARAQSQAEKEREARGETG